MEKKMKLSVKLFVCLMLLASSVSAQAPRLLKDVPLFPDSAIDAKIQEAEKVLFDETTAETRGLKNGEIKTLVTSATPEEVCRWYIEQLKAVEDTGAGFDPEIVENGATSPVQYNLDYYEDQAFENQYEHDTLIYNGEWVKSSLQGRPKSANGKILSNGTFIWEFKNADAGRSEFCLVIDDISFDFYNKTYRPQTKIAISLLEFLEDGAESDEE
jgi:hypothetical protein